MICWQNNAGFEKLLALAVDNINTAQKAHPRSNKFDAFVAQGMSGVLMGAALAREFKLPLAVVGQEGDKHGERVVNFDVITHRMCFVDDHMSGGNTFRRVLKQAIYHNGDISHILVYNTSGYHNSGSPGFYSVGEHPWAERLAVWKKDVEAAEETRRKLLGAVQKAQRTEYRRVFPSTFN